MNQPEDILAYAIAGGASIIAGAIMLGMTSDHNGGTAFSLGLIVAGVAAIGYAFGTTSWSTAMGRRPMGRELS